MNSCDVVAILLAVWYYIVQLTDFFQKPACLFLLRVRQDFFGCFIYDTREVSLMHVKEKFDRIIAAIEDLVQDPALSSREIGLEAARLTGVQFRDLSAIFSFLVDMTLNNYIISRKMDMAYILLTQSGRKLDIQSAVEISGYSDQPSFTKAFRRRYSMTPKEAHGKRDMALLGKPIFWDMLSENLTSPNLPYVTEGEVVREATVFGVSEKSLDLIAEAMELESFYGLPRIFSNYAFELSKSVSRSLEECFRYADSLREYFDETVDIQTVSLDDLAEVGDDSFYQAVFFERGITVSTACELRYDYHATQDELMKCDMTMLNMFPGFERTFSMSFSYYVRAYEYYAEHFAVEEHDHWFNEYIDLVMLGRPIEEAFDEIYPFAASEENFDKDLFGPMDYDYRRDIADEAAYWERNASIENLASEDARWGGVRIDDDLYDDPENRGYDDVDPPDF